MRGFGWVQAFMEYDNKKSGGKWQQERQIGLQIDAYNTVVKQHLDREENVIVRRWLELTEDQYKEYRSYLSLKYAVIY
jgi:hemerythrin-like domain-containing protein